MKNILLIFGLIVFSCSLSFAQGAITVDHIDGLGGPNTLYSSTPIVFHIRYNNTHTSNLFGSTNGFRLISSDGAIWTIPVATSTGTITSAMYDGGIYVNYFSNDGQLSDTIGFGGFRMHNPGIPTGFNEIVLTIETYFDDVQIGKTITLDSCWYPPLGVWEWSSDIILRPSWDGPHNFTIAEYVSPTCQVEFVNCGIPLVSCNPVGDNLNFDHCNSAQHSFEAIDNGASPLPITYSIQSGVGTVDSNTGLWSYSPSMADVGLHTIIVVACNADDSCNTCTQGYTITNNAPVISSICNSNINTTANQTVIFDFDATDTDNCDSLSYSFLTVIPTPVGEYSLDTITGLFSFTPLFVDTAKTFAFSIISSDNLNSDSCGLTVFVASSCCINRGDVDHSGGSVPIGIGDITYLVDYMFNSGPPPPCEDEANANNDTQIGISDLTYIVDYMFGGGPDPDPC